jgi:hypothetical protein
MLRSISTSRRRDQRGVLIIWLALFLLLLLGFIALGMDVAKAIATKTQLQNAADAAALAGAAAINPQTGLIIEDQAINQAVNVGGQNKAFEDVPTAVVIDPNDITFSGDTMITVWARRENDHKMVTAFAQTLGLPKIPVRAHAAAKVIRASKVCNLIPLGARTDTTFVPGCSNVYVLKGPQDSGSGNWGFVDFPKCDQGPCADMNPNGANTLRCLIANGYQCCDTIGQNINSEPGNKSGPFLQAMVDRFNTDTDQRQNICYSDYHGNGARVVNVPIVTPFGNGRSPVTILGFAAFFLRNIPSTGVNSTITGEFLYRADLGSGGGGPRGAGIYFVSLVQ